jgi:RNA polymerase sigma-70 factor (sigma-E family)
MRAPTRQQPAATASLSGVLPGEFDRVYQQYWWPMLRLSIGLVDTTAAAEDVVQDAFVALYRRWHTVRDPQAVPSYLRTSVINAARSTLRRRRTARRHLVALHEETDDSADHTTMLSAEHVMLREAFAKLPQRQREVLALRYLAELSDADIGASLGISEPGVRSAASRALAALRTDLGSQL